MLSSVDLPQPLGPRSAKNSPSPIARFTPSSATTAAVPLRVTYSLRTSTARILSVTSDLESGLPRRDAPLDDPHELVHEVAEDADDQHAHDHVLADEERPVEHDHEAEAALGGHELRRHDRHPRDPETD